MKRYFTLTELLVEKACQIYHSTLVCTGQSREGFGGEKAAMAAASLPVPTINQTTNQPIIAPQQSLRSASGSFPSRRSTAAESGTAPYAAPAPCRTPGGAGGGGHAPCHPRGFSLLSEKMTVCQSDFFVSQVMCRDRKFESLFYHFRDVQTLF